jgi:O-antigen/teichoic acid export membrane protein
MSTDTRKGSLSRKLLSGSVLRLCNLILAAAAAFFLMPLMVHHLGDRLYGFWTLAIAFVGYYGLFDMGMSGAVSQYLGIAIGRKDLEECRVVFNTALRIQSALGCLVLIAAAGTAIASRWFCKSPADADLFWKVIVILGANAALAFPLRVYTGLMEAELRFDIQSGLDLLGQILRTGSIVYVMVTDGGLVELAWMTMLASMPVLFLQVGLARREAPWARIGNAFFEIKKTKEFFSYSIYTFVSMIADILRFQVDALVITAFIGLAVLTHYRIATVFAQYYVNAIIALVGLIQPLFSRLHGAEDKVKLEKVFAFSTKVSLCVSVFICGVVILWGKAFIDCWMGAKYEDAFLPMVILAVAVFLDVSQGPSVSLLYAIFEHRFYTYLNSAEGVLNLVISMLLARPMGIVGVALGTLISAMLIRVVVQPVIVCRVSGIDYRKYLRSTGNNLLRSGALLCVAVASVKWAIRPAYGWLVFSGISASLIYAVGSWFFVLNSGDRWQLENAVFKHKIADES